MEEICRGVTIHTPGFADQLMVDFPLYPQVPGEDVFQVPGTGCTLGVAQMVHLLVIFAPTSERRSEGSQGPGKRPAAPGTRPARARGGAWALKKTTLKKTIPRAPVVPPQVRYDWTLLAPGGSWTDRENEVTLKVPIPW